MRKLDTREKKGFSVASAVSLYIQGVAKYRSPPPQQNWAISQRKPLYFWKAYFNTILYAKYQTIWLVGSLPV